MRLAVTFCNQRESPKRVLACIDEDRATWVDLPDNPDQIGATGMTLDGGRLVVAVQERASRTTLVTFDQDWISTREVLERPRDAHDIAWCDDGYLIASTGTDELFLNDEVVFAASGLRRAERHVNGVTSTGTLHLATCSAHSAGGAGRRSSTVVSSPWMARRSSTGCTTPTRPEWRMASTGSATQGGTGHGE